MNPATGNGTRQQPSNADCRHQPKHPIAVLNHVCKHCGADIDWKPCVACDGEGRVRTGGKCYVCRGTGIDQWEAVP